MEAEYNVASDDDSKAFENEAEDVIRISEIIIISRVGKFYSVFAVLDSLACVMSSYFYSWLACYGDHYKKDTIETWVLILELFFLFSMGIKFLTNYTEEGEKFPVKDWFKIAKRYLNNGFVTDLVALIPCQWIFTHGAYKVKVLYLPKVIRFMSGFEIFDIRHLNKVVKQWHKNNILS